MKASEQISRKQMHAIASDARTMVKDAKNPPPEVKLSRDRATRRAALKAGARLNTSGRIVKPPTVKPSTKAAAKPTGRMMTMDRPKAAAVDARLEQRKATRRALLKKCNLVML